MCGRVTQARGPLEYRLVDGLDVRDSRMSNYPRRWNGAPSQEFQVIRQNHYTGERSIDLLKWGLIPYWCSDPKGGRKPINAKAETVASLPDLSRCLCAPSVHLAGRRLLRVARRTWRKAALRDRHEGRFAIRHRRDLGKLEGPNHR